MFVGSYISFVCVSVRSLLGCVTVVLIVMYYNLFMCVVFVPPLSGRAPCIVFFCCMSLLTPLKLYVCSLFVCVQLLLLFVGLILMCLMFCFCVLFFLVLNSLGGSYLMCVVVFVRLLFVVVTVLCFVLWFCFLLQRVYLCCGFFPLSGRAFFFVYCGLL